MRIWVVLDSTHAGICFWVWCVFLALIWCLRIALRVIIATWCVRLLIGWVRLTRRNWLIFVCICPGIWCFWYILLLIMIVVRFCIGFVRTLMVTFIWSSVFFFILPTQFVSNKIIITHLLHIFKILETIFFFIELILVPNYLANREWLTWVKIVFLVLFPLFVLFSIFVADVENFFDCLRNFKSFIW